MAKNTLYIYEDESGSLADPGSEPVVVALVTTLDPMSLRFLVKEVHRRSLARKGKLYKERGLKEFKYATAGEKDKEEICHLLREKEVDIFVLAIKTDGKKVADSPENYGIVLLEIFEALFRHYKDMNFDFQLALDRHYTNKRQIERLNEVIVTGLGIDIQPIHAESKSNPFIALADFVAGVFREECVYHAIGLSSILSKKVMFREEIFWRDIKRKWVEKLK